MSVVQWNCRGVRPNYEEVLLLVSHHNPDVICLQETFVKSTDKVRFRGFSSYVSPASDTAAGGVAILIRDAPHSPVSLNTTLQAVAVRVTLHRPVTVCSVYIAPTSRLDPILLENLVRQLPSPFLLLGDFNAHSPLWGNNNSDVKGQIIENFLTNSELYLFNDLSPT